MEPEKIWPICVLEVTQDTASVRRILTRLLDAERAGTVLDQAGRYLVLFPNSRDFSVSTMETVEDLLRVIEHNWRVASVLGIRRVSCSGQGSAELLDQVQRFSREIVRRGAAVETRARIQ